MLSVRGTRVDVVDDGEHQPNQQHHGAHTSANEQREHLLPGPFRGGALLATTDTSTEHQQPFPVMLLMIT
jgi:hypothetical protein